MKAHLATGSPLTAYSTIWFERESTCSHRDESGSHLFSQLLDSISKLGLRPHLPAAQIRDRIERLGRVERCGLVPLRIPEIDTPAAVLRLGWGYAITEFLVAPARLPRQLRSSVCSLGALANCMVVTCDRLLDTGARVDEILPSDELATGGDRSPVMRMLREYLNRLRAHVSEAQSLSTRKLIVRMFEAEIQTVTLPAALPYLFWLRKCCLPFLLMAAPVYLNWKTADLSTRFAYLSWLNRVGRFFGVLDDALDLEDDMRQEHPNYFATRSRPAALALLPRIARSCSYTLFWWDAHVPPSQRGMSREAFLHTIWGW